jgi:NADPH:quinone reductase-like Zn-dependent oxidoreductase
VPPEKCVSEQLEGGYNIYVVEDCCGATSNAAQNAGMVALEPRGLDHVEAASVPVVAVTAWQMLFDYAQAKAGQTVLIHGGAGNVGAYAVQLASQAGLQVFATAASDDVGSVKRLGASTVVDYKTTRFEEVVPPIDVVIATFSGVANARFRSTIGTMA